MRRPPASQLPVQGTPLSHESTGAMDIAPATSGPHPEGLLVSDVATAARAIVRVTTFVPEHLRPQTPTTLESNWMNSPDRTWAQPERVPRLPTIGELAASATRIRTRAEDLAQTNPAKNQTIISLRTRGTPEHTILRETVDIGDVAQAVQEEIIHIYISGLPQDEQQAATTAIDLNSLSANIGPLLYTLRHRATHTALGFPIRRKRVTSDHRDLLQQVAILEEYTQEEGSPASRAHKNPQYAAARAVIEKAFFKVRPRS